MKNQPEIKVMPGSEQVLAAPPDDGSGALTAYELRLMAYRLQLVAGLGILLVTASGCRALWRRSVA